MGGADDDMDEDLWQENEEEDVEGIAAFDEDALDEAEVVVEDDQARAKWSISQGQAKEENNQAYTSFIIELDEPADEVSEALKPEHFGPPSVFIVGSDGTELGPLN